MPASCQKHLPRAIVVVTVPNTSVRCPGASIIHVSDHPVRAALPRSDCHGRCGRTLHARGQTPDTSLTNFARVCDDEKQSYAQHCACQTATQSPMTQGSCVESASRLQRTRAIQQPLRQERVATFFCVMCAVFMSCCFSEGAAHAAVPAALQCKCVRMLRCVRATVRIHQVCSPSFGFDHVGVTLSTQ